MSLDRESDEFYLGPATSDGRQFGRVTSDLIGHYGVAAISQRAGAAQATSLVGTASSADFNTDAKAALIEVMNTLTALGLWKGSA